MTADKDKILTILNAAQKRFGHYGFQKTTMTEIAADIGMSKASLYYYFPDKENIFQGVLQREQEEFSADIESMISQNNKGSEMLLSYTERRHIHFKTLLNLAKLRLDALHTSKPVFGNLLDIFTAKEIILVNTILKIGINANEFQKIDTDENARLFVMLMRGLRSVTIKTKEELQSADYDALEKDVMLFTTIFIKGISNPITQQ